MEDLDVFSGEDFDFEDDDFMYFLELFCMKDRLCLKSRLVVLRVS